MIGIRTEVHYRHEWKHEINMADLITIRQRLRAVMEPDPHAIDGKYLIRSLYFDNARDKALREKIDGVNTSIRIPRTGRSGAARTTRPSSRTPAGS